MNTNEKAGNAPAKTGMSQGSQMRISPRERELIKRTFQGNDELLKLLRKIFLPELDPTAPIGQMIDLWMTVSIMDKSPEEAMIELKARNQLISHVDQQLMTLKIISESEELTPEQAVAKIKADSSK